MSNSLRVNTWYNLLSVLPDPKLEVMETETQKVYKTYLVSSRKFGREN